MPVFFLVGGYASAVSWTAHQQRAEGWPACVRGRAMRLLWPTTMYVVVAVLTVTGARMAGANTAELAGAGWFVALHLWFLPVYLLLIALTPVMLAAHRRWGLWVPAVLAVRRRRGGPRRGRSPAAGHRLCQLPAGCGARCTNGRSRGGTAA